jgi:hypothetical protein
LNSFIRTGFWVAIDLEKAGARVAARRAMACMATATMKRKERWVVGGGKRECPSRTRLTMVTGIA